MANDIKVEDDRTGMSPEALRRAVLDHLQFTLAKDLQSATIRDLYTALAHATRDRLVARWIATQRAYSEAGAKRVFYLSAEYLLGRQLEANLLSLGLLDLARKGLAERDLDLGAIFELEPDPGLGNGGLGRLAACFMDSLATLGLPGMGYGIRYEFGIFRQEIEDGWQVEQPDEWLRYGNPWEIPRAEYTVPVHFGGHTETWTDDDGNYRVHWTPATTVWGVPFDTPVAGYGTVHVNTLRLWSARASEQFDLAVFNDGDYRRAVEEKTLSESISKVLYPKDNTIEGKELRLKQQYFFVCCSIADILRRYKRDHDDLTEFPEKVAIQLNDTHPSIAVAELMRVFVDVELVSWEEAWDLTRRTIAYTNHTLLPEALEKWSLPLFERLLPRHLEIIREIDRRFLREVHVRCSGDAARTARMAIIGQGHPGEVRMAHLSIVGAHTVNGVAELHSRLLREFVVRDFADLWPDRFQNKTNGVTPRRWILQCNPMLSGLITKKIGGDWVSDLSKLSELDALANDSAWCDALRDVKSANKDRLAKHLKRYHDVDVDPTSLFDVQVKRIHEYKRQLMCALHVIDLYWRMKFNGEDIVPRTVMFGGKAAPGYIEAKHHIKLINDVAAIINNDQDVADRLKLVFLPNYNVSFAEKVIPAADLSEQISMAGKEASGTGNMKFQMNGALTIGTLDGANIEIREEVGEENFFLFGHSAPEVRGIRAGRYRPQDWIEKTPSLERALDLLDQGYFNPEEPELHARVARYVRQHDPYLICADFQSYVDCQNRAAEAYSDPDRWWPMVARNIARSGKFSSDRTIRQYADEIWGITPVEVDSAVSAIE